MFENNFIEKAGLLILSCIATIGLLLIARFALSHETVDGSMSTLLGMIATGLIAIDKDIIQALRGYQMSAQLGKVTDQLARSAPSEPVVTAEPQPVVVTNTEAEPVPVETKS